jgi:hypothetical protein
LEIKGFKRRQEKETNVPKYDIPPPQKKQKNKSKNKNPRT